MKSLLFLSYCLLIFSEVRTVRYHLAGERSISISDLFFFVIGISFAVFTLIKKRGKVSRQHVKIAKYLIFAFSILALFSLFGWGANTYLVNPLFFAPTFAFFFLSYWLFSYVNQEKTCLYVYYYSILMLILFIAQYLILIDVFNQYSLKSVFGQEFQSVISKYLFYGTGTPALHKPFSSPSQAGLYISIILFLMVGCAITKGIRWPLYLLVPPTFLVIAQTGSRSIMALLIVCWVAFVFLILINKKCSSKQINANNLIVCSFLVLAIFRLDPCNNLVRERSLSFLSSSPLALITGEADSFRANAWKNAIEDEMFESLPKTEISTHNVYLDFLKYLGLIPFAFCVLFLFLMMSIIVSSFFRMKRDPYYPFFVALLVSTILVLGELYANPVLHLRYIWVLFGLTTAMIIKCKFKR